MKNKIKVFISATALGSIAGLSSGSLNNAVATPQTFTGNVVADGPYGNIQVQITVDNGLITGITTPVQPTGASAAYASFAIPTLVTEALAAQSANINAVSGASYISAAWKSSLASAIANAGSAIGVQSTPTPTTPTPTTAPATPAPTTQPNVTPVSNVSNNTVCTTASPTPVSTTTTTQTSTQVDPSPSSTPSTIPSTPTPTPTPTLPTPTPTSTLRSPELGDSEGGADLIARTVTTSGNLTTTITITKVITQSQTINCTTTNTVVNTVNVPVPGPTVYINVPVPGPTVTLTPAPISTPVPPIIIGIPSKPVIHKTPAPGKKIINTIHKKINPYNITVITCQKGYSIAIIAGSQPKCPTGYIKVK